jgi:hypothetical protein
MMKKNRIMMIGSVLLLIGAAAMPLWAQNYGRRGAEAGAVNSVGSNSIGRAGAEYSPEYISQGDFDRIVSSRNETGVISDPSYIF